MIVSFNSNRATIRYPLAENFDAFLKSCAKANYKVLKTKMTAREIIHRNLPYNILSPNNCVSFVKNFIGIKAKWIWSPWQLYVFLRQQKHTEVLK